MRLRVSPKDSALLLVLHITSMRTGFLHRNRLPFKRRKDSIPNIVLSWLAFGIGDAAVAPHAGRRIMQESHVNQLTILIKDEILWRPSRTELSPGFLALIDRK